MTPRGLLVSICGLMAVALAALAFGTRTRTLAETPVVPRPTAEAQSATVDVAGADGARGRPVYAERFSPEAVGAHRQFWDAVQARNGVVYAANTNGVAEYDGATWRLIQTEADLVRDVLHASNDDVYVGGSRGMGVLRPDSVGAMSYHEIVSSDSLAGDAVWGVFEADGAIVVQTFSRLVRLVGDQPVATVRAPEGVRFHKAFDVDGRLIVRQEGAGLMEYVDGALQAVPGGDRFADVPVRALLDTDGQPGGPLLAVTNDELFRVFGGVATPVESAASAVLAQGRAYHGCRLGTGDRSLFAITTFGQGALVVDAGGRLVQHLGPEAGLTPDDLVLGCTVDAQGGLWLALSDGVARVDAAAPLSVFDSGQGLPGTVYDVRRYGGELYAATELGVFRQVPGEAGRPARFAAVAPDQDMVQAWSLMPTPDDGLLIGSTGGVYALSGRGVARVMDGPAYAFERDADGRVLVGLSDGIAVLSPDGGWHEAGRLPVADGEIRALMRVGDAVWGIERNGRLLRIRGDEVEAFGAEAGVPDEVVTLQTIAGAPTLTTVDAGIFEIVPDRLDAGAGIRPLTSLNDFVETVAGGTGATDIYTISEDDRGRVWVSGRERTFALAPDGDAWTDVTPAGLRHVTDLLSVRAERGVTYAGTPLGLYRLVGDGERYEIAGQALVRSLSAEDEGLVFGGAGGEPVGVPYGQALRFTFALPAFNDAPGTEYRSELLGFDRRLSDWSGETIRTYTNLPPGSYVLRVQARTAQGALARAATLAVRIAPPWYLSAWAFALYTLGVLSVLFAVAFVASYRERRKTLRAQARAAELAELNRQLREADRLKDDMLANTSHELRTPLTAIIGFSELLRDYEGGDAAEVRALAGHMHSGGRRLLRTVNDLLDIAQLRAGKHQLKPQPVDAAAVVRGVAAELQPLAAEKGLVYTVHPAELAAPATLDPDALARILTNLISNAVKFTDDGGVAVLVDAADGWLTVAVQDSGCGIAPEFMPRLFDEYVQESTGHARRAEGSGLGLAITRRVVTLMGGTIEIQSEPGLGTRATVRVPLDRESGAGAVTAPAVRTERRQRDRRRVPRTTPDRRKPAAVPTSADAHA